ncbi:MAG: hypothetical protein LC797_00275 [Chloroflexi bacterium]|nr:hypothetical protein [Chloroflexota bacterium]
MSVAARAAPLELVRPTSWREDRPDVRWLGGVGLALVALCGLPYALSALFGPHDLLRMGTFWFSHDFSQYQAAMREGARQSGWLIHDHFSVEPHSAVLMYPLYVAAGKFAALAGMSDVLVFAILEWFGRFAVLSATYLFAATFLEDRRQRRLAVLLSLFTLGLDAWLAPLRLLLDGLGVHALANLLPDSINPFLEVSSFGVLLSAPHLMLGLALTLVCAPLYLRAIGGRHLFVLLLGAAVLSLSLVHSFNTPVLVSVMVVHAILTGRRAWPAAVMAALAAAPMAIYSLLLYQTDPFWSGTYSAQNLMPSPAPWSLPFDFGLVLLVAPLAWPVVRRWPTERRRLILLWIGLGLLGMYAPVAYQRRFAFGLQPALASLAGIGLVELSTWLRVHQLGGVRRRLINYAVLLGASSTSVLVYLSLLAGALLNQPAQVYLWSRPEATAATWLGQHSTATDAVLASTEYANALAGAIDGRVVHGHIVATLHSTEKAGLVQRFFSAEASPPERAEMLAESRATFVAFGPQERILGAADVSTTPGLDVVYDADGVQLFRVGR